MDISDSDSEVDRASRAARLWRMTSIATLDTPDDTKSLPARSDIGHYT